MPAHVCSTYLFKLVLLGVSQIIVEIISYLSPANLTLQIVRTCVFFTIFMIDLFSGKMILAARMASWLLSCDDLNEIEADKVPTEH